MGIQSKFSEIMLKEGNKIVNTIAENYIDILEQQIDKIDEIYNLISNCKGREGKGMHVYGKGRSGTPAVAFALRAKHFGYNVWFGGDVVKERMAPDDVVILFSGSGETSETVDFAEQGKKAEANIITITSYKDSSLARMSNTIFFLPGGLEKNKGWEYVESQLRKSNSKLYGGGLFELYAFLFQETLLTGIGTYDNIERTIIAKVHERDEKSH